MTTAPAHRSARHRVALLLTVAMAATPAVACDEGVPDPVSYDDYVTDLATICTATTDELLALPAAPDQITVADLATSAAQILDDEATQAERLAVPNGDDVPVDDLAGEHRAFVRNTREQADAWRSVATSDDLAAATELVAQLVGGRNELVREMGVEACTRGGL